MTLDLAVRGWGRDQSAAHRGHCDQVRSDEGCRECLPLTFGRAGFFHEAGVDADGLVVVVCGAGLRCGAAFLPVEAAGRAIAGSEAGVEMYREWKCVCR